MAANTKKNTATRFGFILFMPDSEIARKELATTVWQRKQK
jgi:hypothetical protein